MSAVAHEVLPPQNKTIAEYNVTEAALAELEKEFKKDKIDVSTPAGLQAAKQNRMSLVRLRTTLEARRKELKDPVLEQGKLIDAEAKRITSRILAMEEPYDAAIKAEERRKEQEREAKRREEEERIAASIRRIDAVRRIPVDSVNLDSGSIREKIALINAKPDEELVAGMSDSHADEIRKVRAETVKTLEEMADAKERAEAERQRMIAEAAELEEARRIEREKAEAEAAAQQAAMDAEREKIAQERAALDAQRERELEAARAEAAAREKELAELRAAEQQRIAEARAAEDAKRAEEDRIREEERVREERRAEAARARLAAVQAAGPKLASALQSLLERYVSLVNSGDAGNWNPEEDEEVINAREALSAAGIAQ